MYRILKQRERITTAKNLRDNAVPERIEWNAGQSTVFFSDGGQANGSCIHCPNMPCIEYAPTELLVEGFNDFPADLDQRVCPTAAITWNIEDSAPSVNLDECISCGLCVARCPVGAIQFNPGVGAIVNDTENAYFQLSHDRVTQEIVDSIIARLANIPINGSFALENDELIEDVHNRILAKLKTAPKLPQHLTRNLLIALGNSAAMRRQGDVNIRMEIVSSNTDSKGTAEVEFGAGVLDAPRNILDNVAVLHSRYNVPKEEISAFIVSLALPNQRTEYWQVIKDINSVLEIKIGSITVTALMLLLWARQSLLASQDAMFYADSENRSIRASLEASLNRALNISLGHYGVAESSK